MSQPIRARRSSRPTVVASTRRGAWFVAAIAASVALSAPARAQSTKRASLGPANLQGNGACYYSSMSNDGRYVAFVTKASNFDGPFDLNGSFDVFLRDRTAGTTTPISRAHGSLVMGNGASHACEIQRDGKGIVFVSDATNLLPTPDVNGARDVFHKDLVTRKVELISVSTSGSQASKTTNNGVPSANGRHVAFSGTAADIVAGVSGAQVYLRDRQLGTKTLISQHSAGVASNDVSSLGSISSDGRYVAFTPDSNGVYDVFLFDRTAGTNTLVSVGAFGIQGNGESRVPGSVSATGRYISFLSHASNFDPADSNLVDDVYVRDRVDSSQL